MIPNSQDLNRRTLLGGAAAVGATLIFGMPAQAAKPETAYLLGTWQRLVGQQVLIEGSPTYVRKVAEGIGEAFHVSFDGSRLTEGMHRVSHLTFGAVDLFMVVQGDHALCTFNSIAKGR